MPWLKPKELEIVILYLRDMIERPFEHEKCLCSFKYYFYVGDRTAPSMNQKINIIWWKIGSSHWTWNDYILTKYAMDFTNILFWSYLDLNLMRKCKCCLNNYGLIIEGAANYNSENYTMIKIRMKRNKHTNETIEFGYQRLQLYMRISVMSVLLVLHSQIFNSNLHF